MPRESAKRSTRSEEDLGGRGHGGELSTLQRVCFSISISEEDLQNVYYLYI